MASARDKKRSLQFSSTGLLFFIMNPSGYLFDRFGKVFGA
jgi:hypothetical protein